MEKENISAIIKNKRSASDNFLNTFLSKYNLNREDFEINKTENTPRTSFKLPVNYLSINLEQLIKKENISKDEFGRLFDLNRGAISSYLDGKAFPKIETLQKIAKLYDLLIDDLINKDIFNTDSSDIMMEPDYAIFKEERYVEEESLEYKILRKFLGVDFTEFKAQLDRIEDKLDDTMESVTDRIDRLEIGGLIDDEIEKAKKRNRLSFLWVWINKFKNLL